MVCSWCVKAKDAADHGKAAAQLKGRVVLDLPDLAKNREVYVSTCRDNTAARQA